MSAEGQSASKNRVVRVAGLVMKKRPFERESNLRALEELLPMAASQGARLAVTPEGFLEGYIVQTKDLTRERYAEVAERIPGGDCFDRITRLCAKCGVFLAAAMAEKENGKFYNTCALIGPDGKLIGKYRKTHTLNDEPLNTLGDSFPVFRTPLGRIGIMICYDRQPPEVARILTLRGAEIILNPAAGSRGETNTNMMRTRAYENGVPIVFCHHAECLIIDRQGRIIKQVEAENDTLALADTEFGRRGSTIDHRRPELYSDMCERGRQE